MPGAGSLTAANYIYSVAKPDGLTIGFVTPGLYFNQLTEMKEVQVRLGEVCLDRLAGANRTNHLWPRRHAV